MSECSTNVRPPGVEQPIIAAVCDCPARMSPLLKVHILYPSLIIGIVAAAMTALGLALGNRLGRTFGKRMELVGGLVLIGIGLRVVISHLSGA